MKKDEPFFVKLIKFRSIRKPAVKESFDKQDKGIELKNEIENEWRQEYEVIYRSYSLESY